jgi:MYXO-CTERM domain-containing protein
MVALTIAMTLGPDAFAAEAEDDFAARCGGADVVQCVGFDDAADIAGDWDDNSGILAGASTPALDNGIFASGASSLLFTIPSNSPADTSGSYFTNFSEDLSIQFDGNQTFYVQWRQRFSVEFLESDYPGGGGWKQVIIGTGDQPSQHYSSCTDLEVVTVNGYHRGFPQMYNSCSGSTSHGPFEGFEEPYGGSDFKLQNARPEPFCLYSQGNTDPPTYFPPTGNCFAYAADEWMTFQVGIELGPRMGDEFVGSHVRLWLARESEPAELLIDWGPYNLTAGDPTLNQTFGKVWLLPYNTGKDSSAAHATGYTWYDELIVSRSRIPDPGAPPSGGSGGMSGAGGNTGSSGSGNNSTASGAQKGDPSGEPGSSSASGCACRASGTTDHARAALGLLFLLAAFARRRTR